MVTGGPEMGLAGQPTDEAIRRLVDRFYARARRDALLGPVFARAFGEDDAAWAAHLARLGDFWSSVMVRSGRYHGDPFSAHLHLPDIQPAMFERWLALWGETARETLSGEAAANMVAKAERIAESLQLGMFFRLDGSRANAA